MKAGILAKMEAAVAVMQPNEAMIDQADDYRTLFERERARANEERARAECLEAALQDAREAMAQSDKQFKNFHRLLCERFDYVHDEVDWKRDQLSLIEWIATRVAKDQSVAR